MDPREVGVSFNVRLHRNVLKGLMMLTSLAKVISLTFVRVVCFNVRPMSVGNAHAIIATQVRCPTTEKFVYHNEGEAETRRTIAQT